MADGAPAGIIGTTGTELAVAYRAGYPGEAEPAKAGFQQGHCLEEIKPLQPKNGRRMPLIPFSGVAGLEFGMHPKK